MFLLIGLLSGFAAVALLIGAVWTYFSQQRKLESRVATTGTVVELTTTVTASGRSSIYCPIVEFTTIAGETIRFTSDFGTRPASYKIGQNVKVRYDIAEPQKAEIESALTFWLVPAIMVFMGVIACCLAVSFLGVYY